MTDSAAAAPGQTPAGEKPGLSEAQRITNVFFSPSKTFADLKRKASWWAPFLVLLVGSVAMMGVIGQKVGWEQVTQNQINMNPKRAAQMENVPPEKRAGVMETSIAFTKFFSYATPALILLFTVIIAALLMATFNFGLGAEVKFGVCLAIVMYATLPEFLRFVLTIISLYAGASPDSFIIQNPVACNLGALVDASQHSALYALASAVDIFKIWSLILTGIGFACVSKVKRGAAWLVTFGWYTFFTLIFAGIAAAFS